MPRLPGYEETVQLTDAPYKDEDDRMLDEEQLPHASKARSSWTTRRWIVVVVLAGLTLLACGSAVNTHGITDKAYMAWSAMGQAKLELPSCDKTLLYVFSGSKGFNSEFGIYVRAALYAREHNCERLLLNLCSTSADHCCLQTPC